MDITLLCAKRQKILRESFKIRKKSNRKRKKQITYFIYLHSTYDFPPSLCVKFPEYHDLQK